MSAADRDVNAARSIDILPQYVGGEAPLRGRTPGWLFAGVVVFCLLYGMAFAFLAPIAMVAFAAPVAALALIDIWALPNVHVAPTRALSHLLFAFVICLVMWPNYLAFAPPGLPWITMVRLTGLPLVFILLVCVSTSPPFRSQLARALNATPSIWKLYVAFTVLALISVGLSSDKVGSADKFFVAQIGWTGIFFASAYVFLKPGRVERMAGILWVMAVLVGGIGVAEWRASHVLWADHIPSFLKIEDASVLRVLAGNRRSADGIYRAVSTFGSPLALGEYMALTMPFVLQFLFGPYRVFVRLAAGASVVFIMFIAYISGARLGQLGCLLSILLFVGFWAILKWRRQPDSLLAPAVVLSYPVLFLGVFASVFMIGRLRQIVWGSGAEYYSTLARQEQLAMALPKILGHPQGYGMGMGGLALGYSPFGFLTIDSYYLSVALEYGVIGFAVFYLIFGVAIAKASSLFFRLSAPDGDEQFLLPATISLSNFLIIKSVFSGEDNHSLVFMIVGIVCALACRAQKDSGRGRVPDPEQPELQILKPRHAAPT